MMVENPLALLLADGRCMVLDGALATELERRGADLRDPLWSAKALLENPALISQVHLDYFRAGADVAITASYQATFAGFARRGLDRDAAAALMQRSVELACAARDEFWRDSAARQGRLRPLVAASVGPYGAFLANGAEYTGDYGLTVTQLMDFHRPRLAVLAASGADLLACETIPALVEAEALTRLLAEEFTETPAWMSFSCGDGSCLWHGEPIADAVRLAEACPQVVAVGVNCTAPRWIEALLGTMRGVGSKPLLVYPNSGEGWDAAQGCWLAGEPTDFGEAARRWLAAGARLIGGCCRTTPEDIHAIAGTCREVEQARAPSTSV
jgi:homocysteine S-methyltransferase